MRIWIALLVAPVLALTDQSVAYAVVGWACAHQSAYAIHLVHLIFLGATSACAVMAWQARHHAARSNATADASERDFLVPLATASAALSALTVAAMWIPTWLITSCIA
ncbi:MAG: hypothetical protein E6H58_01530 [Betaproteobacteria bacterium]|nr:MAG: hypothetical protein E6H58_01530 [Betaproteobacteria bacterium]